MKKAERKEYNKEYYKKHKKRLLEYKKKRYKDNSDKLIEYQVSYRKDYLQRPNTKKIRKEATWKRQGIVPKDNNWDSVWDILKEQNNCCAICGKNENEFNRSLSLDHDHETGEPREFLCNNCNTALGKFEENIDILASAISYLKQHKHI